MSLSACRSGTYRSILANCRKRLGLRVKAAEVSRPWLRDAFRRKAPGWPPPPP
jgi:hypothetical protein